MPFDGIDYVNFNEQHTPRVVELRQVLPPVDELVAAMSDIKAQQIMAVRDSSVNKMSELIALEMMRRNPQLFRGEICHFTSPVADPDTGDNQVPYQQSGNHPFLLCISRGGDDPTAAARGFFYQSGVYKITGERQKTSLPDGTLSVKFDSEKPPEGYDPKSDFLEGRPLAAFEGMVATGGTLLQAYERLRQKHGTPSKFLVGACVAAKEGVERILEAIPGSEVYAGAVRLKLNDHKYVVGGPGDFGAGAFGTRVTLYEIIRMMNPPKA